MSLLCNEIDILKTQFVLVYGLLAPSLVTEFWRFGYKFSQPGPGNEKGPTCALTQVGPQLYREELASRESA